MTNRKNLQLTAIIEMGVSPEEAAQDWAQAQEDAQNLALLETVQSQRIPREDILGCLADLYTIDGETYILAADLGEALKKKGHELKSFRHLGDALGNGPNGLNLESQKGLEGKNKQKRYYKIPDPSEYSDWYKGAIPRLPKSYYSETAYRLLLAKKAAKAT